MKELQVLCDKSKIKVSAKYSLPRAPVHISHHGSVALFQLPIDHVKSKKSKLSGDIIASSYGQEFLSNHKFLLQ